MKNTLLSSVVAVQPMVMFTGFLGAGKTTLLRELLILLRNKKILPDVILNDRENAFLDKATLDDHAPDVKAITGSCLCCGGFHDLMDAIMKVSKSPHDILLIELNGTADPVPLQESFILLESKFCMRPRWQVCVINARHFRKRRRFNDLESLQLETASHYYISWDSDLTEEEKYKIETGIKEINPQATQTTASELTESICQAIDKNVGHTLVPHKSDGAPSSSVNLNLKKREKGNHHDRHHLAHEFTGCQIIINEPVIQENVVKWLDKLPPSVIRAKALLTLDNDAKCLHLFERVGLDTSPTSISTQTKADRPCSGIFIGPDLDPEEILELTREHLHPNCHFPSVESKSSVE